MAKDPIITAHYIGGISTSLYDFNRIVTNYGKRKTMTRLANSVRKELNTYIPSHTKTMQKEGYEIHVGIKKNIGPYFNLEYRNTPEVPYVMYQYYGKIWEKNYTIFTPVITLSKGTVNRFSPANRRGIKRSGNSWMHSGFRTPKGAKKHPTARSIGIEKWFKQNGTSVHITGYTKKGKHSEWVDWYCNKTHKYSVWCQFTAGKIVDDITKLYKVKKGL